MPNSVFGSVTGASGTSRACAARAASVTIADRDDERSASLKYRHTGTPTRAPQHPIHRRPIIRPPIERRHHAPRFLCPPKPALDVPVCLSVSV